MDATDLILNELVTSGVVKASDLRGLSENEIAAIEKIHGRSLPAAYRAFLARAGRGAGVFLAGTDLFVPSLHELRHWTLELFRECDINFPLSPTHFVFGMHQGYEALFFDSSTGDDPPVYQFVEGQGPPRVVWPSFTAYLREVAAQHRAFYRR